MREALTAVAPFVAGALVAIGVRQGARARRPTLRLGVAWLRGVRLGTSRTHLELSLRRAGWHESPERVVALASVTASGLGALGLCSGLFLDPMTAGALALAGAAFGFGTVAYALRSAITSRTRRLTRELVPLLELFLLELGGGGSPLSALGSVTMQIDSEIAAELRRLLIASQLEGAATFEPGLRAYGDLMQIPALSSLATILTASREYGTGVSPGVRALARDMRRAQRRELIAHSRRALNHVLFPAAIGVLLPFLAILLYPAVSSLQRNLP